MLRFLNQFLLLLMFMLIGMAIPAVCQTPTIDSLTQALSYASDPTTKVEILDKLVREVYSKQPQLALKYGDELLSIGTELKQDAIIALGHDDIGVAQDILGNHSKAMQHYIYALELFSKLNDVKKEAEVLSHIGLLHRKQHNPVKALEIYMRSLALQEKTKSARGIGVAYNNIGSAYKDMRHFTNAIREYEKALNIFDSLGFKKEASYVQNNIGELLLTINKYEEADPLLMSSLEMKETLKDHFGIAVTLNNLARLKLKQQKLAEALAYSKRSLALSQEFQLRSEVLRATYVLANIYAEQGQYAKAYQFEKWHSSLQDSIYNQRTQAQINQMQTNYELTTKESEIELLKKNKIINEKEDEIRLQWIGLLVTGIIALIGIVSLLIWYSQRLRKKGKLLGMQHEEIRMAHENTYVLSEIGKRITSLLTVKDIAQADMSQLNKLLPADVMAIGIYHKDKHVLVFEEVVEFDKKLPRMEVPLTDDTRLSTWCFQHNKELLINNVEEDFKKYTGERPKLIGTSKATASVIYVPLIGSKDSLGVLTIQSFKPNAYLQYHLDIAKNLALYTAIALENAQAFEAIRSAVDKLIVAQEELLQARKMASIGELTKGIAHELNNPINFVLNGTELLHSRVNELHELAQAYARLDQHLPKNEVENLQNFKNLIEYDMLRQDLDSLMEDIKEGAKRSANIVKGLQIFSLPDTGEFRYEDVHTGLNDALSLLGNQIRYKDIQIIKDFDQVGKVFMNPVEINQVFVNLLTNAIQAVNGDGKIAIQTRAISDQIKVSVKDNGCGISDDIQSNIFDPFFTTREAGEGTGLGLSIVYSIIKKHHGKVEVHSQKGEGSEFILWLPKEQPQTEDE